MMESLAGETGYLRDGVRSANLTWNQEWAAVKPVGSKKAVCSVRSTVALSEVLVSTDNLNLRNLTWKA